jgi:hypothetical protein
MNVPWKSHCQGYMAEAGDLHFLIMPVGSRTFHWTVHVRAELKDSPKWRGQVTFGAFDDCRSMKAAKEAAERAGDYIQAAYEGMKKFLAEQE